MLFSLVRHTSTRCFTCTTSSRLSNRCYGSSTLMSKSSYGTISLMRRMVRSLPNTYDDIDSVMSDSRVVFLSFRLMINSSIDSSYSQFQAVFGSKSALARSDLSFSIEIIKDSLNLDIIHTISSRKSILTQSPANKDKL